MNNTFKETIMSNEFDQLEEKLDIESIKEEEKDIIKFERKEVTSDDEHTTDIKTDYDNIRTDIVNDINATRGVTDTIRDSILNSDPDDKFLARKTETFACVIRAGI